MWVLFEYKTIFSLLLANDDKIQLDIEVGLTTISFI